MRKEERRKRRRQIEVHTSAAGRRSSPVKRGVFPDFHVFAVTLRSSVLSNICISLSCVCVCVCAVLRCNTIHFIPFPVCMLMGLLFSPAWPLQGLLGWGLDITSPTPSSQSLPSPAGGSDHKQSSVTGSLDSYVLRLLNSGWCNQPGRNRRAHRHRDIDLKKDPFT